ncbi:MAG TPA: cytochrome c oxidase assembly protein [Planococcus sp. (in: firmicutes)]|nr:cytochrome c oxidase assembly protein [Planococcus sp. (in: firmicutes)]
MHSGHSTHTAGTVYEAALILVVILALTLYPIAGILTSKLYRKWPPSRYFFWYTGVLAAMAALVGPLAERAQTDFVAHMAGHLLLGMLSPILLVFARPMTLLLRSLPVTAGRQLSRLLKSGPIHFLSNPLVAAILNLGGLAVLYTTDLYMLMHQSLVLHIMIHLHVFLAGYLFTISIIYIDLTTHRYSFLYRSVVLILALAAHKILSKHIYASPPVGVPREEAQTGGMLMYYGGDLIDLALITILCYQWYKAAAPRPLPADAAGQKG